MNKIYTFFQNQKNIKMSIKNSSLDFKIYSKLLNLLATTDDATSELLHH